MYDIAVVGAGPAGSMAAYTAAKQGCKVILIEEHPEIGIPLACGEGIGREWLEKFVTPKPSWIASTIDSAMFYSPSWRSFTVKYPNVGYILERKIFDRDLAGLAAEAGAEIKINTRATKLTKDGVEVISKRVRGPASTQGEIKAKIVIGAEGISSRLARQTGINSKLEKKDFWIGTEYLLGGVDVVPGRVEFITGLEFAPGGYGWVFPKSKGLANVGAGVAPTLTKQSPRVYLDKIIKKRFQRYTILEVSESIVPSKKLNQLVKDNFCVVGDAGRLVDPISGGGIINALLSGKLAGEASAMAIKHNDINRLKSYEKEWALAEGKGFGFKLMVRDVFLKLKDEDLELLFDFGNKNFGNKVITEVNDLEIIRSIITFSPRFLKLAGYLLKSMVGR